MTCAWCGEPSESAYCDPCEALVAAVANLRPLTGHTDDPGACPDCAARLWFADHRPDCPQLRDLCIFCQQPKMALSPEDCIHVTVHTIAMEATVHPVPLLMFRTRTCTVCNKKMWELGDDATAHPCCRDTLRLRPKRPRPAHFQEARGAR